MVSPASSPHPPGKRRRLERVKAACDLCKLRKVKCNGVQPCTYCLNRHRANSCRFSAPPGVGGEALISVRDIRPDPPPTIEHPQSATSDPASSPSATRSNNLERDGAAVPLDGRLLRDTQGKAIFIGDCAPLSFLQTVRHLVASEIDPDDINVPPVRDSVIEVAPAAVPHTSKAWATPVLRPDEVSNLVSDYLAATAGLVDLFDQNTVVVDIQSSLECPSDEVASFVCLLILAIGMLDRDEAKAEQWFQHVRHVFMNDLFNTMTVATVQGYTLLALYTLRAFQPNAASLYFSLAARNAYAIGLHRTEANASFGPSNQKLRDKIWKSLRCLDMLISNLLGRPPSTSDVDCTVEYSPGANYDNVAGTILHASVQMFMIIERVVVEVYSRKRISLRIANFVSHQHKTWASKWLTPLNSMLYQRSLAKWTRLGACQILCTYYYGIMLLTRPFLVYDLYEHLRAGGSPEHTGNQSDHEERKRYADAALDAAIALVDTVQEIIDAGDMPARMPMLVSWLFASALVLAVGVLGRGEKSLQHSCEAAIASLDYFARSDPHARQYGKISQTLLDTALRHIEKQDQLRREQRKLASSQLFGLLPAETAKTPGHTTSRRLSRVQTGAETSNDETGRGEIPTQLLPNNQDWTIYNGDFFALPWLNENDAGLQDFLQPGRHGLEGAFIDVPLFPMDDPMGFLMAPEGHGNGP